MTKKIATTRKTIAAFKNNYCNIAKMSAETITKKEEGGGLGRSPGLRDVAAAARFLAPWPPDCKRPWRAPLWEEKPI
jgi:hypothetical protein